MGRRTTSMSYLKPIVMSTGAEVPAAPGTDANLTKRGAFTLTAATTYFFIIPSADVWCLSAHLVFDAAIALVAKIEDCDFPEGEVDDYADGSAGVTAGFWVDEDPTTAFVGTVGAGNTVTNGVLTHVAGAQGGARFNVVDQGARRTRLRVDVGATGGEVKCGWWAKE